ncbi:MAG: glycosyltransferase, partial [Actinobacteria bacterium]|nr:glycosyltransferase [Actinomycetota bacterium]
RRPPAGTAAVASPAVRVLHVNKFLHRRGGAEAYLLDLAGLQRRAGHQVALFGTDHPDNEPQEHAAHFPSYLELEPPPATVTGRLRAAGRMLWSSSAARGLDAVVDAFRPDVAHLHNVYHHLSPSVLRPLARRGVPAVMTLHDYKLACPTYRFLDHGQLCEACLGGHFTNAVRRRCKDGSLPASALMALELGLHTAMGAYEPVSRFVCPSRFLAAKMAQAGVFPDRLRHVPHFVDAASLPPAAGHRAGVVYAGRLSPEKGVDVLVEAVARLDRPGFRNIVGAGLEVLGDGPARPALERLAAARAPGRVSFRGRRDRPEVLERLRSAQVAVLPSRWYENQPLIVLEALACGVPVVASDLGGTAELVDHGVDGLLVPPDDPGALAAALARLLDDPGTTARMGAAGAVKAAGAFSPELHLERIHSLYAEAARSVRPVPVGA